METFGKRDIIDSPRDLDSKLLKDQPSRLRARASARLEKLTGDLYLLCGAYHDAVNTLVSAAEDTKTNGDLLWHATAQESLQVALVLQSEVTLAEKREAAAILWIALPEKLRDVAPLYQKSEMSLLAFEVYRNTANLLAFAGSPAEAAMALCQGWAVHRQLGFSDKLYVLTVIISKFELLMMPRKRAFYLQALCALLNANKEDPPALTILSKTFPTYKIDLAKVSSDGWPSLKLAVIQKAVALASTHRDRRLMIEYCCTLLGYARGQLDSEEQVKIAKTLKSRVRQSKVPNLDMIIALPCLLPLLSEISIDLEAPELWRQSDLTEMKRDLSKDTFIYNPSMAKEKKQKKPRILAVAAEDTLPVKVALCNPFAFPIDLVGLCLVSDTVELQVEEIVLTLPAWTKTTSITLMCIPKQTGVLTISHVEALIYGVRMRLTPTSGRSLTIPIIKQQPTLKIENHDIMRVSLLRGEKIEHKLKLCNFGPNEIVRVHAEISHRWENKRYKYDHDLTIDDLLFSNRPNPITVVCGGLEKDIQSGESRSFQVIIHGVLGWY